jgi:NADPH:quinone reductase-like Zn-dependent oxidoreductase
VVRDGGGRNLTMRAVVMEKYGGPEVLHVADLPVEEPGPGEVLIDVRAAGVGFSDLLFRMGLRKLERLPAVLGYEVAGTIAARGPDVTEPDVGSRVVAFVPHGGYAERVTARVGDLLALPERLSFEQGAAIPLAFSTAYAALVRFGACIPGERVLIHGAGGGVGSAAALLARRLQLETWGTASPAKHDAIRELGIDHPLDYTSDDWHHGLPEFDLIMDPLGGASFRRSYCSLGAGGRLVCFGVSGMMAGERRSILAALKTLVRTPRFNPIKQITDSRSVIGLDTNALWRRYGDLSALLQPLGSFLGADGVDPLVAAAVPFDEAPRAHRMLSERSNVGKVVLVPSD